MKQRGHLLLVTGAVLVVLVVLVLARSLDRNWLNTLGDAFWELPEAAMQLDRDRERERELEAWGRALFARLEAKKRITEEVIAGHLSLVEAARRLHHLYQSVPDFEREVKRLLWPEMSDEERDCQAVIVSVRVALQGEPEKAREVVSRLEAELARMRQRYGPTPQTHLPAFSSGSQVVLSGLSLPRS